MKIHLEWQKRRTENSKNIWKEWYKEYIDGKTVQEIAQSHINPVTNKPFSRANVYYGFRRLNGNNK